MTPTETIDGDLTATRVKWREAVLAENREAEAVCMGRLNHLLDLRLTVTRRPKPARSQ